MQAASQGITSFVSSGDSGASGCDGGSDSSGSGLGVNGLASTPYNVAVGGTQFNDASGSYWNTDNGINGGSAISYIPEKAWNESAASGGKDLWATGGGASSIYPKPSWQVSPGVPSDRKRDIPDVSLTAAGHDGYRVRTEGNWYIFGGTSASSPAFAGLMVLIVQKTGQRWGINANTRFYQLGNAQYSSGGAAVFHDTITGNNSVPGVTGYPCTTGYDLATGLGSVDATALVNAFSPLNIAPAITSPASVTLVTGVSTSFTVLSTGNPVPSISMTGTLPGSFTFIDNGNGSATISGSAAAIGIYPITITAANTAGSINQGLTLILASNKGDIDGDGKVNIADALLALRTSVGLYSATQQEIDRADVAPFVNGSPEPDGNIDINDALMILKKSVGLAVF
jgi:subtilase family serine protease